MKPNGREPGLHQDSEITGKEPMLGGDKAVVVGVDWGNSDCSGLCIYQMSDGGGWEFFTFARLEIIRAFGVPAEYFSDGPRV